MMIIYMLGLRSYNLLLQQGLNPMRMDVQALSTWFEHFVGSNSAPATGAHAVWQFGTVKSVGSQFGFIRCQETYMTFGHDVFVSQDLLWNSHLAPGDPVWFLLQLDPQTGRPQAAS